MNIKVEKLHGYKQVIGLMFKNKISPVYFETRFGIHTFFVRKLIDVLILDNKNKVVKMVKGLKPFKVYIWSPKYYRVIEGPFGFIDKYKIILNKQVILDIVNASQ